jgi:hypothetical protein
MPKDLILEYGFCMFLVSLFPVGVVAVIYTWKGGDKIISYLCALGTMWVLFGVYVLWPR